VRPATPAGGEGLQWRVPPTSFVATTRILAVAR
jgi:hypothetical protein